MPLIWRISNHRGVVIVETQSDADSTTTVRAEEARFARYHIWPEIEHIGMIHRCITESTIAVVRFREAYEHRRPGFGRDRLVVQQYE